MIQPTIRTSANPMTRGIAVRVADGTRYALTTTCAANVLGLAKPGDHAHGNREAARKAFAPLAETLNWAVTIDEARESAGLGQLTPTRSGGTPWCT